MKVNLRVLRLYRCGDVLAINFSVRCLQMQVVSQVKCRLGKSSFPNLRMVMIITDTLLVQQTAISKQLVVISSVPLFSWLTPQNDLWHSGTCQTGTMWYKSFLVLSPLITATRYQRISQTGLCSCNRCDKAVILTRLNRPIFGRLRPKLFTRHCNSEHLAHNSNCQSNHGIRLIHLFKLSTTANKCDGRRFQFQIQLDQV